MRRRKSEMERSLEGRICTPLHYYDWRGSITSDTRGLEVLFGRRGILMDLASSVVLRDGESNAKSRNLLPIAPQIL
jgi:hypothetical protein